MKAFSLDNLPKYSPWPERLLGLTPFVREPRTEDSLMREYESEKYPHIANYVSSYPEVSWDELRRQELGLVEKNELIVSRKGELFLGTLEEVEKKRLELFLQSVLPHIRSGDTVLDLGGGYGYNLQKIIEKVEQIVPINAEFSPTARELCDRLSQGTINTVPFNLFNEDWSTLAQVHGERICIISSHAIEMMPSALPMIERLAPLKERITSVIHFEPVYVQQSPETLLNLLRRQYIDVNQYNTNLHMALTSISDVILDEYVYDLFGLNPLFPESLLRWHYK